MFLATGSLLSLYERDSNTSNIGIVNVGFGTATWRVGTVVSVLKSGELESELCPQELLYVEGDHVFVHSHLIDHRPK